MVYYRNIYTICIRQFSNFPFIFYNKNEDDKCNYFFILVENLLKRFKKIADKAKDDNNEKPKQNWEKNPPKKDKPKKEEPKKDEPKKEEPKKDDDFIEHDEFKKDKEEKKKKETKKPTDFVNDLLNSDGGFIPNIDPKIVFI